MDASLKREPGGACAIVKFTYSGSLLASIAGFFPMIAGEIGELKQPGSDEFALAVKGHGNACRVGRPRWVRQQSTGHNCGAGNRYRQSRLR
jgi:hypothetical protein